MYPGVPVYVRWNLVPDGLITRSAAKREGIEIPKDAKPDGIKGGGQMMGRPRIYQLFRMKKYAARHEFSAPAGFALCSLCGLTETDGSHEK